MCMKVEHRLTKEPEPKPFDVDGFIHDLYELDPEVLFRGKVLLDQRKVIELAKRHKDRCILQFDSVETMQSKLPPDGRGIV